MTMVFFVETTQKDHFGLKIISYFLMFIKPWKELPWEMEKHHYFGLTYRRMLVFISSYLTCYPIYAKKIYNTVHEVIHSEYLEDLFHLPLFLTNVCII
jgi:hypothetical protein